MQKMWRLCQKVGPVVRELESSGIDFGAASGKLRVVSKTSPHHRPPSRCGNWMRTRLAPMVQIEAKFAQSRLTVRNFSASFDRMVGRAASVVTRDAENGS